MTRPDPRLERPTIAADELARRLERHLSRPARFGYVALLLGGLVVAGMVAVLWATEPAPLPGPTQAAFAGIIVVGLAWSGLAAWALSRRRPLYATDLVVAGYLAVVVTSVAAIGAVVVAAARGQALAAALAAGEGLIMVGVAATVTVRARRRRAALLARRRALQRPDA